MPSDSKKKRDAKKKEAAKSRGQKKPVENGTDQEENGVNGENGTTCENGVASVEAAFDELTLAAKHRSVTGVLASHHESRDVHIHNLSILFHGAELLTESTLELNVGRRYGLIGLNGCGKSSLLAALAAREVPVPDHIDIFLLRREMAASDKTALECVMEVDEERHRLELEAEELAHNQDPAAHERLMDVYERLEDLDASKAQVKAAYILHGLGFTRAMQHTKVKDFSGGWRMRIALARALFIRPALMLLDEPTNHLDLNACVWLEEELKTYPRILVVISHSQDFLNGVCTNIIHFHEKKMKYYGGNFDSFVQTRFELEENQMKRYKWEQDQIAHMKSVLPFLELHIPKTESKTKKILVKGKWNRKESGMTVSLYFPSCGKIPPPVIMVQHVSFRYAEDKKWIYKDLDFGVDLDTRVALVGPNGAGKSTLLKLITGELIPSDGLIRRHSHLKIGRYHQHLGDQLDLDLSALEYMMKCYPEIKDREEMRKIVGRFGLTGAQQTCPIRNLSDGQRCRVTFAWLAWQCPHLLLLDEPTNHLDIETIDALAEAINDFEGGMILVSHDFRLISQVTEEIWVCEKETITKWEGDIFSYKHQLIKDTQKENAKLSQ
ncbi:hypothetical protein EGW08_015451 [Elysia chlorotica]|uniref:ABC transporter domain-containing protein n=1 Tax=Elysia chlorotica TaxID=188477 RepID=A0A3S1B5T5_ELYCH|nr:hypothetical protein EGW08_015451 [Elysia chlorotica]